MNIVIQLCEDNDTPIDVHLPGNFDDSKPLEVIRRLAPIFKDTFLQCFFRDVWHECESLFSPMFTEKGLCYTFNGLPGADIYRTSEYI